MTGIVKMTNPKRSMVAVWTDEGYTIIELLGDDVEIGDRLTWPGSAPLGGQTVWNATQGVKMDVFMQDHHVSSANLLARGSFVS